VPLSGHNAARDAPDLAATAAAPPRPAPPRGRFGVAEFPVDASLAAAAERALPSRRRIEPEPPASAGGGSRKLVAVAVVMALLIGGGVVFALGRGGPAEPAAQERPTIPPTSLGFQITIPTVVPEGSTTSEPWVPEEPDPDLIVYDSPGLIQPSQDLIEFRDASTFETLRLVNNGGGAANWLLSVQAGSGLEVNPAEGQLKPGESVEVHILLDRANGRPLTDWAEDITMIGGGNTRPTSVRVKIFAL